MGSKNTGFDAAALVEQFRAASQRQGDALRRATHDATLQALQRRELTLKAVRDAIRQVTAAATQGAQANTAGTQAELLLARAVEGMDGAVRQAVQAQQQALQQFVAQGMDSQDKPFRKALADLEKMEDALFDGIAKASEKAGTMPWPEVAGSARDAGSATARAAADAVQQLGEQARQALRDGRAAGTQAAAALFEHYAALATGVLIGFAQATQAMASAAPAASAAPRARKGG